MEISKIKIYHKSRPNSSGVTSLNKAIQITLASLPPFSPLHHSFTLHRSPDLHTSASRLGVNSTLESTPFCFQTRLREKLPLQSLATFFSSKFWNLQIRQKLIPLTAFSYSAAKVILPRGVVPVLLTPFHRRVEEEQSDLPSGYSTDSSLYIITSQLPSPSGWILPSKMDIIEGRDSSVLFSYYSYSLTLSFLHSITKEDLLISLMNM